MMGERERERGEKGKLMQGSKHGGKKKVSRERKMRRTGKRRRRRM